MKKPNRTDEKYWSTTSEFDHIQYELDIEKYILETEATQQEQDYNDGTNGNIIEEYN